MPITTVYERVLRELRALAEMKLIANGRWSLCDQDIEDEMMAILKDFNFGKR